jgi:hypothetical protein
MADRCERNSDEDFGGCMVLIPPPDQNGNAECIEILLVDPAQDLADFWSTAKSKAAIAADEFVANHAMPQMGQFR